MSATLPSLPVGHLLTGQDMGQILSALRITNLEVLNVIGTASLSSSSTSYVDITNGSLTFTKQGDATFSDVAVLLAISSSRATSSTQTTFGVNINSTDFDVVIFNWNTAGQHQTAVGFRRITNIPAGTYTVKSRAKGSAANAMSIDSNDTVSLVVIELPK